MVGCRMRVRCRDEGDNAGNNIHARNKNNVRCVLGGRKIIHMNRQFLRLRCKEVSSREAALAYVVEPGTSPRAAPQPGGCSRKMLRFR